MNDRANPQALVQSTIPALQVMTEEDLCKVLQNSIYPGAALPSIKMVLGYCKANGLDPMTKPVHIVPMEVKTDKKDAEGDPIYEKRDVVMPGIELYRTKATSTGRYVGCTEPEFGPMKVIKFQEQYWENRQKRYREAELEYPEWCRVTVKRLVDNLLCEFTAVEYWLENYATAGNWTTAPNKMWRKRPRGQLAKCTQAQALRAGFPDAIGAQPTAEEMEGKTLDPSEVIDHEVPKLAMPKEKPAEASAVPRADAAKPVEGEVIPRAEPKSAVTAAPKSQVDMIRKKAEQATITIDEIAKHFNLATVDKTTGELLDPLAGITTEQGNAILDFIRNPAGE